MMNTSQFIKQLPDINFINGTIKLFFILVFTYYIFIKITNLKKIKKVTTIASITDIFFITLVAMLVRYSCSNYYSIIVQIFCLIILNLINYKKDIIYIILNTVISLSISYLLLTISIAISFIPNVFFGIKNDYINLIILILIYIMIVIVFFKIKRIKNGFAFLKNKLLKDELFSLLMLNIGIIVLFTVMVLTGEEIKRNLAITLFILAIVMFITVKKSLEIYYKQKLLITELNETKKELEFKKKEVQDLEKENLEFSKKSHTLAHKQNILEHKINEMSENIAEKEKSNIKMEIDELAKEVYSKPDSVELSEIGIPEIDETLRYFQSECIKNHIDFEVQINGNIYYMINNLISKEELQILIADHLKDAIIAINYSDNINRNILIKIGKIDEFYGLYIYDSGVEFKKDTLENLGKKPITTHAENGGTGMGFMNTFDTLKKHKASLIIGQIGAPSKDNFTKIIMIKFDGKDEFVILSYNS